MIDDEKKFSKSPSPLKKRRRLSLMDKKIMKDLKKQIKDIEDEKNQPEESNKFTSSQFNQFTYILFKNFESKGIVQDESTNKYYSCSSLKNCIKCKSKDVCTYCKEGCILNNNACEENKESDDESP